MENKLEELKKALETFSLDKIEEKEKDEEKLIRIDFDSSHIDWNSMLSSSGNTISTAASASSPWATTGGGGAGNTGAYSYSFGGAGGGGGINFTNNTNSGLQVNGDASFDGDIKWRGRSLGDMLRSIEDRLAILTPDPAKIEHFEALKKAYEHYKTLEALCTLPDKKEK